MLPSTISILPDGTRARVRLPHSSDRAALRGLHERLGFEVGELELARALRFDPRHRLVACLTAWDGRAEQLLGYGAITLGAPDVDLLVVDGRSAAELLAGALRAATAGRARTAA